MAGNIFLASGAVISGFGMQASGQGTQLANAAALFCSGNFNNTGVSGGPAIFAFAEFTCAASGFANSGVSSNTTIDFYLVPSRDGTNFMDANTGVPNLPTNHFKGSFVIANSGNSRHRLGIEGIPLLPVIYRAYIQNNTGATLASGWSLQIDGFAEAYT